MSFELACARKFSEDNRTFFSELSESLSRLRWPIHIINAVVDKTKLLVVNKLQYTVESRFLEPLRDAKLVRVRKIGVKITVFDWGRETTYDHFWPSYRQVRKTEGSRSRDFTIERSSHFNVTAAFPNYDRPCQYQHFPTSESYETSLNNG